MDAFDKRIVAALQRDAGLSNAALAETIGLSATPCWRRVQALERAGVIRRRVALASPQALNVGVSVFVRVRTDQHSAAWLEQFRRAVEDIPEITGLYRMSGDIDYLMRIVVPDIAAYDAVYQRLIRKVQFAEVTANFAMEIIKETTELPLHYAD